VTESFVKRAREREKHRMKSNSMAGNIGQPIGAPIATGPAVGTFPRTLRGPTMGDIRAALREDYCKTGGCHPSHCVCGLLEDAADHIDVLVQALTEIAQLSRDGESRATAHAALRAVVSTPSGDAQ
jgi:hypothetical protein